MLNPFKEALVGEYGQQACPDMHIALLKLCGSMSLCFYSRIKHISHMNTLPALLHSNHNTGMWGWAFQMVHTHRTHGYSPLLFMSFRKVTPMAKDCEGTLCMKNPVAVPASWSEYKASLQVHTRTHTGPLCDSSLVWKVSSLSQWSAFCIQRQKRFRFKHLKRK